MKFYRLLLLPLFLILFAFFWPKSAQAIVDPLASPNNKFGIHIIGASVDEASPAATLVNSSGGDWGYITVLVESKNRNQKAWQKFFDDLRRRHLVPIVRLATEPQGDSWKLPYDGEDQAWADFLDSLNWPIKNRYVVIYNEPNHAKEWGNKVDARSYAKILDKTITALKSKNQDFFVLNAGFDASTPSLLPKFEDEAVFMRAMNEEVQGIFNKLDGWVSHSYPNPGFAGSPTASGRGTVRTWVWELGLLKELGVSKDLPVFITETGWKHAEGIVFNKFLPSPETVGQYFKEAFVNAWNNNQIVAVTPFLLNYQEEPFDHFSFKKLTGEKEEFYPQYQTIMEMPKISGKPFQENKAELTKGTIYSSIVTDEKYEIPLTFKNIGQSIWGEYGPVELRAAYGGQELGFTSAKLLTKVEPGNDAVFKIVLKTNDPGTHKLSLQLFSGGKPFEGSPLEFNVEAKSPVILNISAGLLWKQNFAGEYILKIASDVLTSTARVILDSGGTSMPLEDRYLLPDYSFDFTLYKPFYKPKTIGMKVKSGINNLNFGTLEPDFLSAVLHPRELWKLLPWSN